MNYETDVQIAVLWTGQTDIGPELVCANGLEVERSVCVSDA